MGAGPAPRDGDQQSILPKNWPHFPLLVFQTLLETLHTVLPARSERFLCRPHPPDPSGSNIYIASTRVDRPSLSLRFSRVTSPSWSSTRGGGCILEQRLSVGVRVIGPPL